MTRRTERGDEHDDEEPPPGARLFVGAWPPPEVSALLSSLDRPTLDAVRWTTSEQWHVTFAFLGNVPLSRIDEVGGGLASAISSVIVPPEAKLGPSSRRVGRSILCVPVGGLDDLAASVRDALRGVLPDSDLDRPFQGHLTLARARGRRTIPAELAGMPVEAHWRVREVDLVRSDLAPSGARYTTLVSTTVPS